MLNSTTYLYENPDFLWHVTGILDTNGLRRWTVEYDADGHAITSKGPNDANKTTVSYAPIQYPSYTRTVTNALGKVTVFHFDGSNTSLTSVEGTASANCVASNATYSYQYGRIISKTDAEGRTTTYDGRNDQGATRMGQARPVQEQHRSPGTHPCTLPTRWCRPA